ncbi:carbamate kinase [Parendozoicomonas haliclonae]|uniref:Carbamate kinase n=1 Tax=Parendozoicomonas haliclonae TaxID=1960125 RepID=A0A1X7AJM5_9GAMM|nr:carbamate kinase [Parendozoicomonas haliclonae]SMA46169.1 Carbamate kinase 2 [Parendozoicomonas haliclonae]
MRVVIALGGNAILQRGEPLECEVQRKNIREAAEAIARIARDHQVILTHGNGPQVGLLALMNEAYGKVTPYPLDALGAQTQGMIGFMFEQELRNCMPGREVCTVSTQTLVDPEDPAFAAPDKFVGPVYSLEDSVEVQNQNPHWVMKADGQYMRRVVPSPMPKEILELSSLQHLIANEQITLICGGGGGVPVKRAPDGKLVGVEAVIDKDRASRVLAEGIEADALLILSDVEAVATNFGQPDSQNIQYITPEAMDKFNFAAGSMGPKVEACVQFVRNGGQMAAIGSLAKAAEILTGDSGTVIRNDVKEGVRYYE